MDRPRYEADRAKDLRLSAVGGIDAIMKSERLARPRRDGGPVSSRLTLYFGGSIESPVSPES